MAFAIVVLAALLALAAPAAGDCMDSCQGDYNACMHAYGARDCASTRSICQQGCILKGSPRFGAIAYSVSSGKFGFAFDYPSRAQAERRAIAECAKRSGGVDCATEIWFFDNCGAIALGPKPIRGSAYAASEAMARGQALQSCRARSQGAPCRIEASVCSK